MVSVQNVFLLTKMLSQLFSLFLCIFSTSSVGLLFNLDYNFFWSTNSRNHEESNLIWASSILYLSNFVAAPNHRLNCYKMTGSYFLNILMCHSEAKVIQIMHHNSCISHRMWGHVQNCLSHVLPSQTVKLTVSVCSSLFWWVYVHTGECPIALHYIHF